MPSVTINIAGRGTPTADGGVSSVGHMWFSLNDGNGEISSYGFSPDANNIGNPFAQGDVNTHGPDDIYYQGRDYSRTIEITQAQYDSMKSFGENPTAYGFDTFYNGLSNSCIDFTWKALQVGGLNNGKYEGSIWPTDNIEDLRKFVDLSSIEIKRIEEFLKETLPLTWTSVISHTLGNTPDPFIKNIRYVWVDPLVLDLDGDGIEITSLASKIQFDTNGDGIKTGTAWVQADDGLLVWDRNGNGLIDSGRELFGDETLLANGQKAAHGFAALGELDVGGGNGGAGDGVFDARDAQYANLRIWRDLNQDGISQASELQTLAEAGIASIKLGSTATNTKYPDAQLVQTGSFVRTDGSEGQAGSFILAQNNFTTTHTAIQLSIQAQSLLDIKGSGWVRDFREAATLNPQLIFLLEQAKNANTRPQYFSAIGDLIRAWGNGSDYKTASDTALLQGQGLILREPLGDQEVGWMEMAIKASAVDRNAFRATLNSTDLAKFDTMREEMVGGLERLYAYEAFTGFTFLTGERVLKDAENYVEPTVVVGNGGRRQPIEEWVPLSTIIWENRTAVKSLVSGYVRVTIPEPLEGLPHITNLWNRIVEDAGGNLMPGLRLAKYLDMVSLQVTDDGMRMDFSQMNAALSQSQATDAGEGAALFLDLYKVYGDTFSKAGWNGMEQLRGQMQAAASNAAVGEAFAVAGFLPAGTMQGSTADDIYLGDHNANSFSGDAGDDLIDGLGGDDTLRGGFGNDQLFGGDGNDALYGEDGNDQLFGGAGDDLLEGGNGDDVIDGGDGDDTITDKWGYNILKGGAGNDVITGQGSFEGGNGDDVLIGVEFYADTYLFNRGDGKDTIWDWGVNGYTGHGWEGRDDVLRFGEGIEASAVQVLRSGYDMVFKVSDSDQVTVKEWFLNAHRYMEQVQFADGTVWTVGSLREKVVLSTEGTDADETIVGWEGADVLDGGAGNDKIYGGDGNDQLFGGAGDDLLEGGNGDDVIDGGDGDDTITDKWGYNIFKGGAGNDVITGQGSFEGGNGDDVLIGVEFSADTYLFNRGDGKDTIWDWGVNGYTGHGWEGRDDVLRFGEGIEASAVQVLRSGYDMVFKISDSDQVTVKEWFLNAHRYMEQVQFADGTVWTVGSLREKVVLSTEGTDADETIVGWEGADVLDGGAGNDKIYGGDGNDQLFGGAGDDLLEGGNGDDVIDGGDGDDTITDKWGYNILKGGAGNDVITGQGSFEGGNGDDVLIGVEFSADTYLFNRGDGKDTIWDWGVNGYTGHGWEGRDDVLRFGEGIEASAVQVLRSGYDMVFKVSDSDQVTVKEWFLNAHRYMEQVQFADGTVWTVGSLREKVVLSTVGTEADDTIAGSEGKDLIDGGPGNDRLQGGTGNDTYLMRRGSGADTISDYDTTAGNTDTLLFDQDVAFDQLWLRRAGSSLEVSIIGTDDRSTIENWYAGAAYRVEQIKTSDGRMLIDSQVDALVSAMAAFAPPAAGQTTLPADYRTTLAPVLASSWN